MTSAGSGMAKHGKCERSGGRDDAGNGIARTGGKWGCLRG